MTFLKLVNKLKGEGLLGHVGKDAGPDGLSVARAC